MKVIKQVELDHPEVAQITVKVPYFAVQYRTQAMLMEYVRCYYLRSVSCAVCCSGLPSVAKFVLKALGSIITHILYLLILPIHTKSVSGQHDCQYL